MNVVASMGAQLSPVAAILALMAAIALLEVAVPLRARGRWGRAHVVPNLALTAMALATNVACNGAAVAALAWLDARGAGLLRALALPSALSAALAIAWLDLCFYVGHVLLHRVPALWRLHRVHHSDLAVDVTTSIRQHPLEGPFVVAVLGAGACLLGVTPALFAAYRATSGVVALLEHANLRVPGRLARALALVTTRPYVHKTHHSRDVREADSNYGNLLNWYDRLLGTWTPPRRALEVRHGLDGLDDEKTQSTAGLLLLPFHSRRATTGASLAGASYLT